MALWTHNVHKLIGGYSILLTCGNSLPSESSLAKAPAERTIPKPFSESVCGFSHTPGSNFINFAARYSTSFTAPRNSGLYRSSVSVRLSSMTDTQSPSWTFLLASASMCQWLLRTYMLLVKSSWTWILTSSRVASSSTISAITIAESLPS